MQDKRCPQCEQVKPLSMFYVEKDGKPSGWCIDCKNVHATSYYHKKRNLLKEEHPPGASCDVCGNAFDKKGPHWDHDKGAGRNRGWITNPDHKFRGWLCGPCNRALGCGGENPKILRALADYLEGKGFTATRPFSTFK